MNKQEFLSALEQGLRGLPPEEARERLSFYAEMIDDRMEEGLPEREAVAAIGTPEDVIGQIAAEIPLARLVKEHVRPQHKLRAWEIVLLVLGFPLWFPLLLACAAVALSVYLVLWAVIVSLWAVDLSFAAGVLAAFFTAAVLFLRGFGAAALAALSAGILCAGLAILFFFVCLAAGRGLVKLTKKTALSLKTGLVQKGVQE